MTKKEKIISCIDFTSLNAIDNAINLDTWLKTIDISQPPAAICVYPDLGQLVKTKLPDIKTAVVATAFPSTHTFLKVKKLELELIANTTIDEVDIVINLGAVKEGNWAKVEEELTIFRSILAEKTLKVILETGLLEAHEIKRAAALSIKCGADFIKTSTGKNGPGADENAVNIMCQVILAHYEKSGKKVGIKPSGGIRSLKDAEQYYNIILECLGEEWLTPSLFRIGASSLYHELLKS